MHAYYEVDQFGDTDGVGGGHSLTGLQWTLRTAKRIARSEIWLKREKQAVLGPLALGGDTPLVNATDFVRDLHDMGYTMAQIIGGLQWIRRNKCIDAWPQQASSYHVNGACDHQIIACVDFIMQRFDASNVVNLYK